MIVLLSRNNRNSNERLSTADTTNGVRVRLIVVVHIAIVEVHVARVRLGVLRGGPVIARAAFFRAVFSQAPDFSKKMLCVLCSELKA